MSTALERLRAKRAGEATENSSEGAPMSALERLRARRGEELVEPAVPEPTEDDYRTATEMGPPEPPPPPTFGEQLSAFAEDAPRALGRSAVDAANTLLYKPVGALAVIADKAKGLVTGNIETELQDAYFRNTVGELDRYGSQELAPKHPDTFGGKLGYGTGYMAGTLPYMVATGGEAAPAMAATEAAASGWQVAGRAMAASLEHSAKASVVPMMEAFDQRAQQGIAAGEDETTALLNAATEIPKTIAYNALPLSVQGRLATRIASGAAIGASTAAALGGTGEDVAISATQQGLLSAFMGGRAPPKFEKPKDRFVDTKVPETGVPAFDAGVRAAAEFNVKVDPKEGFAPKEFALPKVKLEPLPDTTTTMEKPRFSRPVTMQEGPFVDRTGLPTVEANIVPPKVEGVRSERELGKATDTTTETTPVMRPEAPMSEATKTFYPPSDPSWRGKPVRAGKAGEASATVDRQAVIDSARGDTGLDFNERSQPAGAPVAKERVRAHLDSAKGTWADNIRRGLSKGRVEIVSRAEGEKELGRKLEGIAGTYDRASGKVYLFHDNLRESDFDPKNGKGIDPVSLAAHEMTHAALQEQLERSGRFTGWTNRLSDFAKAGLPVAQQALTRAKARSRAARENGVDPEIAAKIERAESLAHVMEYASKNADKPLGRIASLVREAKDMVRFALNQKGWVVKDSDLSFEEMHRAAQRLAKQYAGGKEFRTPEGTKAAQLVKENRKIAFDGDKRLEALRTRVAEVNKAKAKQPEAATMDNAREEPKQAKPAVTEGHTPAKPRTFTRMKTDVEATGPAELKGVSRLLRTWANPIGTGKATEAAHEAKGQVAQSATAELARMQASKNQMDAARKLPGGADASKNPILKSVLGNARDRIDGFTRMLRAEIVKHRPERLDGEDINVLKKMADQIGNYVYRSYRAFGPSGVGERYGKNLLKNASATIKPRTSDAKAARIREAKATVDEAKAYVRDSLLRVHEDPESLDTDTLQRSVAAWGANPSQSREGLIATLDAIRERNPGLAEVERIADAEIKNLLGLNKGPTSGNTGLKAFYRPSVMDRTVVTARENVPPAIRKLWGEVTEPHLALFSTWAKIATAVAQMRYLNEEYERGTGGGGERFLFDAVKDDFDRERFSAKFEGKQFGPMDGLHTTPRFKETVEAQLQGRHLLNDFLADTDPKNAMLQGFLGAWDKTGRKLGNWTKMTSTVLKIPGGIIQNAFGVPMHLLLNGNLSPKSLKPAMKALKDTIMRYHRKEISAEALEVQMVGAVDSALVGELLSAHDRDVFNDLVGADIGKAETVGRALVSVIKSGGDLARDLFAAPDMLAKFANYFYEKNFLTDYYKRQGVPRSEREIAMEAGMRIKRTNPSYARAPAIFKAVEGIPLTQFITYNAEIWRSSIMSLKQGIEDAAEGTRQKDAKAIAHGVKRIAGATTALTMSQKIMSGLVLPAASLLGLGVSSLFGAGTDEDSEKQRIIQEGMGDIGDGKSLAEIEYDRKPGDPMFLTDVGREDPYGPATDVVRLAMQGKYDEALEELKDQAMPNALLKDLYKAFTGKRPAMATNNPAQYDAWFDTLSNKLGPGLANAFLNMSEHTTPGTIKNVASWSYRDETVPKEVRIMEALGLNPVIYDPKQTVEMEVANKFVAPTRKAFYDFKDQLKDGYFPDDEKLEREIRSMQDDQFKAYTETQKAIRGAKMAGLDTVSLHKAIKAGEADNDDRAMLANEKFQPSIMSERSFNDMAKELIDKKKTQAEKDRMRADLRNLKGRIIKIKEKIAREDKQLFGGN